MNAWTTSEDRDDEAALGLTVIGAGVRAGRLGLGLSQRQLAWRVGLSQSAISRLETGTLQGLRLRTLGRIVGVLEASPGYVFADGPPPPTRRLPGQPTAWPVGRSATTPAKPGVRPEAREVVIA